MSGEQTQWPRAEDQRSIWTCLILILPRITLVYFTLIWILNRSLWRLGLPLMDSRRLQWRLEWRRYMETSLGPTLLASHINDIFLEQFLSQVNGMRCWVCFAFAVMFILGNLARIVEMGSEASFNHCMELLQSICVTLTPYSVQATTAITWEASTIEKGLNNFQKAKAQRKFSR